MLRLNIQESIETSKLSWIIERLSLMAICSSDAFHRRKEAGINGVCALQTRLSQAACNVES